MEKQSKILIVLLIVFLICVGVFWFQFNNNVSSKGTVYNEGKIVKTTNYFNNNSSTNCPNIWNNGVCEQ